MTTYLLDADVLVALVVEEHGKDPQVMTWAGDLRDSDRMAVCPVVEGALVRFLVRVGVPAPDAAQVVGGVRAAAGVDWWTDTTSYADLDLSLVRGHRQVTDAYLVGAATSRPGATLVTLDRALAATWPQVHLLG